MAECDDTLVPSCLDLFRQRLFGFMAMWNSQLRPFWLKVLRTRQIRNKLSKGEKFFGALGAPRPTELFSIAWGWSLWSRFWRRCGERRTFSIWNDLIWCKLFENLAKWPMGDFLWAAGLNFNSKFVQKSKFWLFLQIFFRGRKIFCLRNSKFDENPSVISSNSAGVTFCGPLGYSSRSCIIQKSKVWNFSLIFARRCKIF